MLVRSSEYRVSRHGFRELLAEDILLADVLAGIETGLAIEEYPDSRKEPSVLILQYDKAGKPIHVMWGIPKEFNTQAILVTAYRPAPDRWSADFTKRSKR